MALNTSERKFEEEIENSLLSFGGYVKGSSSDFDKDYAVDRVKLFEFLKSSQSKEWDKLEAKYNGNAEEGFLKRLTKELKSRGMIDLLRNGIIDSPAKFSLCFFEPVSSLNKTDSDNYQKNILSITRQVYYSTKNQNSIDTVLFVNGLPITTIELKNPATGQTVVNAKAQYKQTRDNREPLLKFKSSCLVHFAVDTDEVWMTTKLDGKNTVFLPFNKGVDGGAGNPVVENNYRTSYLWNDILEKSSLLDIIRRFAHVTSKVSDNGAKMETLIFPRFHQLDAVRKLSADIKSVGTGKNYLIQHSAGSGKSNTISWLAHHLQNLHDNNDKVIFNSIIVITDRRVLDRQLQDTIYQFEHVDGVVQKIDNNSTQLAEAINTGKKIIITTLQKFPFIIEKVNDLSGKRFAVIVDEAHSSQTGEASKKLKAIIGDEYAGLSDEEKLQRIADKELKEENSTDSEDEIFKELSTQGKLNNLSFFAFTATPKPKTIEMFGVRGADGIPKAFHVYSMKQAIEEGFILDVLKNYMTYTTYFKLGKSISDDPRYEKGKANKALGKYLSLHPHNLSQRTKIIIEHFRTVTKDKIGGNAKAMVVTSSRLHAVRYYFEFKKYIEEMGYQDELGILVAFSGKLKDGDSEYTETSINDIRESELPDKFHSAEYQVLLVAEKYQTGFDEPLLHTMFVDKKLSGVKAVQTLSRLNRICNGKEDTFILDFVNSTEDIKQSFEPYYNESTIEDVTDSNIVYDLKTKLDEYRIYWDSEIENFSEVFFKPTRDESNIDFGILNSYIDPAVDRFKEVTEDEQADFKSTLTKFIRIYAFVSNIVKLDDYDLHKFYAYAKCLLRKLPKKSSETVSIDDEVALQYYRLQKIFEGSIELEKSEAMQNTMHAGSMLQQDEKTELSKLIESINEKFATDFEEENIVRIISKLGSDEELKPKAQHNSIEHFDYPLKEAVIDLVVENIRKDEKFSKMMLDNEEFREMVISLIREPIYEALREQ